MHSIVADTPGGGYTSITGGQRKAAALGVAAAYEGM